MCRYIDAPVIAGQDGHMGSMGKRRGRRTRSDEGKLRVDPRDGWGMRHSALTFEGRMESLAKFTRNVSRSPRLKRRAGRVFAGAVLGVFVVGAIIGLVTLVLR